MKIIQGTIASPKGFYADGLNCGLRKVKHDIGWVISETLANAAAVYTTNQIQAAPISKTKEALNVNDKLKGVVVNAGVANACTGLQGFHDAFEMQSLAAKKIGVAPTEIAVASTGVIGKLLPMNHIRQGIDGLSLTKDNAYGFHQSILTTDTSTKEIVVTSELGGKLITLAGVAKGSGMIHPNLATMLAFLTTDATISSELLEASLKKVVQQSFNQITVDGDTSTNDMVLVLANGCAGSPEIIEGTPEYFQFMEMLEFVTEVLAKKIARDGEGATKLIEVEVINANTINNARFLAKKIVGSSLVKSAMFGADPNWGRIICAAGYAGPTIDPTKIEIWLGTEKVVAAGEPVKFNQSEMTDILKRETIKILVDLKHGEASGLAWGCDLTYKYVEINACYRT